MSIDIGTGDGRAVLARARDEPGALALGIDADASRMSEAASRGARKTSKGGAPNARFLVCTAEALPRELAATADLVTVQFPWGSLLQGIVRGEPGILAPIARLLKPSADSELRLLLSVEPRDRVLGLAILDDRGVAAIEHALADLGLEAREARRASAIDLATSHSTWAKRLRAGSDDRAAWLLSFGARPEVGSLSSASRPRSPAWPRSPASRPRSRLRPRTCPATKE